LTIRTVNQMQNAAQAIPEISRAKDVDMARLYPSKSELRNRKRTEKATKHCADVLRPTLRLIVGKNPRYNQCFAIRKSRTVLEDRPT
jgi:hypothetical protein